jgi:hypothetical protein
MGGYASKCGAVEGLSQGLVCPARLVSQVNCRELLGDRHGQCPCEEMDTGNPPDFDMVAQAVLHWAGRCRQQLIHENNNNSNNYVRMLQC